jgi:hypothetical protein
MKLHAFYESRVFAALVSILACLVIAIGLGMVAVLSISLMIVMPFLGVLNAITLLITGKGLDGRSAKTYGSELLRNTSYGSGKTGG